MTDSIEPREPALAHAPDDLPAVEPPTAGFIVQLFLIPAMIVAVVVVVYLLFGKIAGGHRTPAEYLADLRGANEERRWLAAHELALVLRSDKAWQNDQQFAAELAAQLQNELAKSSRDERATQYQQYLASALGAFNSPAGIRSLCEATVPEVATDVRVSAIWSLARLGDRLGADASQPGSSALAEAIPALVAAGNDEDPAVRKLVAFALGAIRRPEGISGLTPLLHDSDREVSYNAAAALARLGSTAGLDRLHEMLDLEGLNQLFPRGDGGVQANAQVEAIAYSALESLSQLLDRAPRTDLTALRPAIEGASERGTPVVQTSAKKLLIKMANSPSQ